jgi:hypothetical protein
MKADAKPTLEIVAQKLANGAPPPWLVPALGSFAALIRGERQDSELETIERKVFQSAEYLQRWLRLYALLDDYGFEVPDCIDNVGNGLEELLPFLLEQMHSPSGDVRRILCAAVCVEGYRLLHNGHLEPHSADLRQACEDLWQASGNPTTAKAAGADARDNWRRSIEQVVSGDEWVRSRFELYKNGTKII